MKRSPIKRVRAKARPGRLRGAALEALRKACFDRANGCCEECGCYLLYRARWDGDPIAYDMAHKRNKRMHGDTLDNVRALCHADHMASHNCGNKPVPRKVAA